MTFANTIFQDGLVLLDRVIGPKLRILLAAVALLVVVSVIYIDYIGEDLLFLFLKGGFVVVGILFIAQALLLIAFVYKMLFCALLGPSEDAPLNGDFWRFVGFCVLVGILIIIVQFVVTVIPVLLAQFVVDITILAESALLLVLLGVLHSFVLTVILFGLGTIFPAHIVGVNAGFGDAFNRLKSQLSYVASRVLLILAIQLGLSLLQTGITSLLVPVSAEGLSQVSLLIVGMMSLAAFFISLYLLVVSLIVVCRVFVRADFRRIAASDRDLHETRLELPYLAGPDIEVHVRKPETGAAS